MWILPAEIQPRDAKFDPSLHEPRPGLAYDSEQFKECLRHEFGYVCALCLVAQRDVVLHDLDLERGPWGVFGVEHIAPQHLQRARRNDYANCLWACRACNRSRGSVEDERLLNPRAAAWGARFAAAEGTLTCRASADAAAHFTHKTYKLDDERKVKMRQHRRDKLGMLHAKRAQIIAAIRALEARAAASEARSQAFRSKARELTTLLRQCEQDMQQFQAAPVRRAPCGCAQQPAADLPDWLQQQCTWIG